LETNQKRGDLRMNNKILGSVLGSALLASSSVALADAPLAAENFSSTLTFTSDYTFRGATANAGNAAMQGSFDWGQGAFFAGVWGSNADTGVTGEGLEIDVYFGWADSVAGFDLMVMPIWYTYPDAAESTKGSLETFEIWTSAGIGFDNIPGTPYVTLGLDFSNDYFSTGESIHATLNAAFTVGDFGIDATYGNLDADGAESTAAYDYSYYNVGVSTSAAGFGFDLRYHDTSDEADIGSLALDGETVLTVSRSF